MAGIVEHRYSKQTITIENALKWVYYRIVVGALIASMYGISPFVFHEYLSIKEEMFIFIILSAMTSIAVAGSTVMPFYYVTLSVCTMTPLALFFLTYQDTLHITLGITAILWQIMVLRKGLKVSKATISAIELNEQLQDEIQHHKETKAQLHQLATHDALTGIPNRRLLEENLKSMFALAQTNQQKVIVVFIDLDGFKQVNDHFGHEAGDQLLKQVATRLKTYCGKSDAIARMGGDEFILGFRQTDDSTNTIELLANQLIQSISQPVTLANGHTANVGASIGISVFPDDGQEVETLIQKSDKRMYWSKTHGKGTFTHKSEA